MEEEILRAAEVLNQIMEKKPIVALSFEHQDIICEDKIKNFLHLLLPICVLCGKLV